MSECKECSEIGLNQCLCPTCDECGSKNLEYYDDGEGYPPNILCKDCDNWNQ